MPKIINTKHSIDNRIVRSGTITFLSHFLNLTLRLGSNLILTRLLVPEMFGIMAIAQVFAFIISLLSDIGIAPSIIRSKRGTELEFINTAWTIQVIRGVFISIIIAIIGFIIMWANHNQLIPENSVYSEPVLPSVIAFIAITSAINGFDSTNIITAQRNLLIGRLVIMELFSQVIGIVTMITWAYYFNTIWSLVIGSIVTSSTRMILSHWIFPDGISNKFLWDKEAFKEIFHFGKWIFVSSLFTAFYVQGDRLILGALTSAKTLGIYSIALIISVAVSDLIGKISSSVFFPAMSEIHRTTPDAVLSYYYKTRKLFDAFTISVAGILYSSSEMLIKLLYPPSYSDAGWMLQIISLTLIFKAPILSTSMMFAIGKSKYSASLQAIQTCLLIILFPLFFSIGGMQLAIWSLVLVAFCSYIFDLYYRNKTRLLIFASEFRMLPMFIIGLLIGELFNFIIFNYFTYTL